MSTEVALRDSSGTDELHAAVVALTSKQRAELVDPRNTTPLAVLLRRWLPSRSPRTKEAYLRDVAAWLGWLGTRYVETDGAAIYAPITANGRTLGEWMDATTDVADSTRSRRASAVRGWYYWLASEGVPVEVPVPPKGAVPVVKGDDAKALGGLSTAKARELLDASRGRTLHVEAMVAYLLGTGLRVSEALQLVVSDLDGDDGGRVLVTVIGKGKKKRTVQVPAHVVVVLRRLIRDYADVRGDDPHVFVKTTGKVWTRNEVYCAVESLGRAIGVSGLHPHSMRHTWATLQLHEGGANVVDVQAALGHAALTTTQRYVTVNRPRFSAAPMRVEPAG